MKRLVFIGASGHGKVCAEVAELSNKYSEILFLDDSLNTRKFGKYDVAGKSNDFFQYINENTDFFVSIGNTEARRSIQNRIEKADGNIACIIHPKSIVSPDVQIGAGTVIMAGAVINPNTQIGRGCIINTSSSVDHDCNIGDYCHIAVGAHVCGTVNVGEMVWIGSGATVINNISVISECVIGAGAVVVKNIEKKGTYVGLPARMKKKK